MRGQLRRDLDALFETHPVVERYFHGTAVNILSLQPQKCYARDCLQPLSSRMQPLGRVHIENQFVHNESQAPQRKRIPGNRGILLLITEPTEFVLFLIIVDVFSIHHHFSDDLFIRNRKRSRLQYEIISIRITKLRHAIVAGPLIIPMPQPTELVGLAAQALTGQFHAQGSQIICGLHGQQI